MTTQLAIDTSHSSIGFTVRHMMFAKVRGHFGQWKGTIAFDEADPTRSRVEVHIDAASIDTREPKRDAHLRSPDFLDAEKHPALDFISGKIESLGGTRYRVDGALTIRGTTKAVVLEAELLGKGKDPWGNERVGFHATTRINRKEFGLTWNQALETGGILVGEEVEISLDVEAVKADAATQAA
jgi:polyisoprenoid-binding protein YceI